MSSPAFARAAVIGGSGFYDFLDDVTAISVTTPYGDPSAPIQVGRLDGIEVAFLPRHGNKHEFPPHRINYRANLWALASLGVQQVIAPCAVGGLDTSMAPGDLVVPDQLVDRTRSREGTFVESGPVHAPFADPYCARLRRTLVEAGPGARDGATMVVIEGPRFSTRAESGSYARSGWHLVNMTGLPEAALARELGLCYAAIALVTDLDAGLVEGEGVSAAEVFAEFARHVTGLKTVVTTAVGRLRNTQACNCDDWADGLELDFRPNRRSDQTSDEAGHPMKPGIR